LEKTIKYSKFSYLKWRRRESDLTGFAQSATYTFRERTEGIERTEIHESHTLGTHILARLRLTLLLHQTKVSQDQI